MDGNPVWRFIHFPVLGMHERANEACCTPAAIVVVVVVVVGLGVEGHSEASRRELDANRAEAGGLIYCR